jgi:hypothetical protein
MYVNISIMRPAQGHEEQLLASMQRFCAAARTAGSTLCTTVRDEGGALVGIAAWESAADARAAGPALMQAVEGDDFEAWVAEETHYRGLGV